jgi:hypothetical protein
MSYFIGALLQLVFFLSFFYYLRVLSVSSLCKIFRDKISVSLEAIVSAILSKENVYVHVYYSERFPR